MFLFKKILSPFLFPLPLCVEILLAGILLLWFTKKQSWGKSMATLGAVLLVLLSCGFVTGDMLRRLEQQYPPIMENRGTPVPADSPDAVKWIVVLGGGNIPDSRIPVISRLTEASLVRLAEGIRLYRENPGSKLLLSGGPVFGECSDAEIMVAAASLLGVPDEDMAAETKSRDTEEEAVAIAPIVGEQKFLLVTSASHMPRAAALFRKRGMHPIAVPVGQSGAGGGFYPSPAGLRKATTLFYEYLGIAWSKLRSRI